jgi:hypothetical protein
MRHAAPADQVTPATPEIEELPFRIRAVLGACPRLQMIEDTRHRVCSVALCPEEAPLEQADLRLLVERTVFCPHRARYREDKDTPHLRLWW